MKKLINKIKNGTLTQMLTELRWIAGNGQKYLWVILWNIFLGVLGTGLGLAAGILSKDIIDIVTGHQTGFALRAAILFAGMHLVRILLSAITGRISAKVQLQVGQSLRRDIFKRILQARWEPLSRYHSGDLLTRAGRDVDTVAGSIMGWLPSLLVNSLQLLGTFLVLFFFDRTLALLALASAPVTLLLSGFLTRRLRHHSKQMRELGAEMTAFHAETFQNILFVKSFRAEEQYCQKLAQHQQKQWNITLEYNRFSILISSFLSLIGVVVGGVCFFWSVYRLWGNHITFGEMTLFLQLSGSLSGAFSGLVSLIPAAITAATAAGRIMEVTQLPSEEFCVTPELEQLQHTTTGVQVVAENLRFSYESGKEVFQNASFQADAGQIVALIGPSGGGKTTFLRLLLGMVTAQAGSLRLQGGDPETNLPVSPSTRTLFAYVPQDNTLFSGTVAENLRITCPDAPAELLEQVLQVACAYDFVNALPQGIHTRIGERGNGLSEGQIQRLCVARALLSDAPILLLDEATSALDPETERKLLHNIMNYRKNRTCIVTTHRPSVLALCHRVYTVDKHTITPAQGENSPEE